MSADSLIITTKEQFRQKAERRRDLAKLPIEEKLKKLVKLQAIAFTIGRQAGREPRKPWGMRAPRVV